MYLVEIESGREALYESVNALASAIRRGEVGPRSRIFHRATSSWISIKLHPEFRKATAVPDNEPLPPLARNRWTFFGIEPGARPTEGQADGVEEAGQDAGKPEQRHGGLKALLGRALRSLSSSPRASETSGS